MLNGDVQFMIVICIKCMQYHLVVFQTYSNTTHFANDKPPPQKNKATTYSQSDKFVYHAKTDTLGL